MGFNWKFRYVLQQQHEKEFSYIPKKPGIYLWTRTEDGNTYFYVGQAKNLFSRHFNYYCLLKGLTYPTRHFEASLKKHKDWTYKILECCEEKDLDKNEQYWIKYYNSLPNCITRNELLAGNDIVRSNYRRIKQIENKRDRALKECLDRLDYTFDHNSLKISVKMNKKGTFNQISLKAYQKLLELLQIGEKNEQNK